MEAKNEKFQRNGRTLGLYAAKVPSTPIEITEKKFSGRFNKSILKESPGKLIVVFCGS